MNRMEALGNYFDLIERVDELCAQITVKYEAHIACRKGCADCCRCFTLFPVEAEALSTALRELPRFRRDYIRQRVKSAPSGDACPLLEEGACLLYSARPIICRTHGMPILVVRDGRRRVDVCPLNFKNVESLPGSAMIELDRLNTTLAAINALFIARRDRPGAQERIDMARALLRI